MSLVDTIYDFATGANEPTPYKYSVTRTASGPYVNGNATVGAATSFLITALVTPTTGREVQILEDAGITSESRRVRTDTKLQTRGNGFEDDVITIDGESWAVFTVARTEALDEVIYRAIVARQSTR